MKQTFYGLKNVWRPVEVKSYFAENFESFGYQETFLVLGQIRSKRKKNKQLSLNKVEMLVSGNAYLKQLISSPLK